MNRKILIAGFVFLISGIAQAQTPEWANPDYANNVLGWKARESIEDTLQSAWNWQVKLKMK
jgi:UDP-glucose 4-epimerase